MSYRALLVPGEVLEGGRDVDLGHHLHPLHEVTRDIELCCNMILYHIIYSINYNYIIHML